MANDPYQSPTNAGADVANPFQVGNPNINNGQGIDPSTYQPTGVQNQVNLPTPAQASGGGNDFSGTGVASDASDQNMTAWNNAMMAFQTKVEGDNPLQKAKLALLKGLYTYNVPLSDDEKAALTPSMQLAMQSNNRNLISTIVSSLDQQIAGYNKGIDTNITNVSNALKDTNTYTQGILNNIKDMKDAGVSDQDIASYIKASGANLNPSDFGLATQSGGGIEVNVATGTHLGVDPNGRDTGQCGAFVNDYLGQSVFGDTYQQKSSMINTYSAAPGEVAIIPVTGQYASEGHVAIVESVNQDGSVNVVESNYEHSGVVDRRTVPASQIAGYYASTSAPNGKYKATTIQASTSGSDSTVQGWVNDINSNHATFGNVPLALRSQVSSALAANPSLSFNQIEKIEASVNGFPRLVKGIPASGQFLGFGGTPATQDVYEWKDPSTGQISNSPTLDEASANQNAAVLKAEQDNSSGGQTTSVASNWNASSQTLTVNGTEVSVGQTFTFTNDNGAEVQGTLQSDGTVSGDDGNTYDSNGNLINS